MSKIKISLEATKDLDHVLETYLSRDRIIHCRNTAELSRMLSHKFRADESRAYAAGLLHDIARELDWQALVRLAITDGTAVSPHEAEHPILLHGRAGAVIIREELGIEDQYILDAVRFHTSGHTGMDTIGCIVYMADFLEPGRKYKDKIDRDSILGMDLPEMMLEVTVQKFGFLLKKNRTATESAIKMYEELKVKKNYRDS
jgi:nicotinate-nucleotide adenylyltransferase